MGVKDLWLILDPIKHQWRLSELKGKTLAVDLSCWVCEADTAKGLSMAVPKAHLRNLFFRIHRLYGYGASLVFVVDGEAIQLKWSTLDQREKSRKGYCHGDKKTGHRRQLDSKIRECCHLLDILGIPHIQAVGEADALCGLLNLNGIVDGVITTDSDVFLYGANTVYRGLSTNGKNPQVDCYTAEDIQSKLGLNRSDLISLALLLGCDYCPQGVPGVGKESAMKLIRSCRSRDQSCDMLEVFRGWSSGAEVESTIEKQVQRKALLVSEFPNEAIISEYSIARDRLPREKDLQWACPNIKKALVFCSTHLEWKTTYTYDWMVQLLTQWLMRDKVHLVTLGGNHTRDCDNTVRPISIVCSRVRQFVPCYQMKWEACTSVVPVVTRSEVSSVPGSSPSPVATKPKWVEFVTVENADQFKMAFPELCSKFEEEKALKKALKEATKKKKKPKAVRKKPAGSSSNKETSSTLHSPSKLLSLDLQTLTLSPARYGQPSITSTSSSGAAGLSHKVPMFHLSDSTNQCLISEARQDDQPCCTRDSAGISNLATIADVVSCNSGQDSSDEQDELPLPLMQRLQSSGQTFKLLQDRTELSQDKTVQDQIYQDSNLDGEHEVVYIIDSDSETNSDDVITDEDDIIEITASPKRPCPNQTKCCQPVKISPSALLANKPSSITSKKQGFNHLDSGEKHLDNVNFDTPILHTVNTSKETTSPALAKQNTTSSPCNNHPGSNNPTIRDSFLHSLHTSTYPETTRNSLHVKDRDVSSSKPIGNSTSSFHNLSSHGRHPNTSNSSLPTSVWNVSENHKDDTLVSGECPSYPIVIN